MTLIELAAKIPASIPDPGSKQESNMDTKTKTAPAKKAPAKKPAKAKKKTAKKAAAPKAEKSGSRSRYDWAAAEALAEKGKLPPALDFSAETHARFRGTLEEVVKAAKAADAKALAAIQINPVSSSPKALDRYRGLCVKAVKAKGSAAA